MSDEANTEAPVAPESAPADAAAPAGEPAQTPAPETPAQTETAPEVAQEAPAPVPEEFKVAEVTVESPAPAASPEVQAAKDDLTELESEVESLKEREETYETPEDHPSRLAPGLRPTPAGPETAPHDDENRA